jgi:hypothetical protein
MKLWVVLRAASAMAIDRMVKKLIPTSRIRTHSGTGSVILQSTDRHGILGHKPTDFQLSL